MPPMHFVAQSGPLKRIARSKLNGPALTTQLVLKSDSQYIALVAEALSLFDPALHGARLEDKKYSSVLTH